MSLDDPDGRVEHVLSRDHYARVESRCDEQGVRFLDYEREDWERHEWEQREEIESVEAEEARWAHRMRIGAERPQVHYQDQPGLDRRLHDVSGMRSMA